MAAAARVQLFASRMNAFFFFSMISFSHMLHLPFDKHLNQQGKKILAFKCNKNNRYLLPSPVIVLTLCYCTGSAHSSSSDGVDGIII